MCHKTKPNQTKPAMGKKEYDRLGFFTLVWQPDKEKKTSILLNFA